MVDKIRRALVSVSDKRGVVELVDVAGASSADGEDQGVHCATERGEDRRDGGADLGTIGHVERHR